LNEKKACGPLNCQLHIQEDIQRQNFGKNHDAPPQYRRKKKLKAKEIDRERFWRKYTTKIKNKKEER
jgi:hypothetical protein